MDPSKTKNTKNSEAEQEWKVLDKGPRSRTERNNLKKVGTCPALASSCKDIEILNSEFVAKTQFFYKYKFKFCLRVCI